MLGARLPDLDDHRNGCILRVNIHLLYGDTDAGPGGDAEGAEMAEGVAVSLGPNSNVFLIVSDTV
jgi:hypothetical protein